MDGRAGYRGGVVFALRGVVVFALALLGLGFAVSEAEAAEFPYTLDQRLSLMGDCGITPGVDEVKDPDCEPTYPAPPNGPSGRFDRPFSVAVDDWGNLYVASRSSTGSEGRIDIFDPEGRFINELETLNGPQSIAVDGKGNLYSYEEAEAGPGAKKILRYPPATYEPSVGKIVYDAKTAVTVTSGFAGFMGLGIDRRNLSDPTDDRLFADNEFKIEIFAPASEGNVFETKLEPTGTGGIELNLSKYVAIDAVRRLLYTTTCKEAGKNCVVWVLEADAPYNFIEEISGSQTPAGKFFSLQGAISIAADESNGHLFVGDLGARPDIYELDESYGFVSRFKIPAALEGSPVQSDVAENFKDPDPADENATDNYRYLYVPLSYASGNALAFEPPEVGPPEVDDITAQGIGESEAELEAWVRPHQLETSYSIQYVTEAQYANDGFGSATVAKGGTLGGVNPPQRVGVVITDLIPGVKYRYRVLAENEVGADEEEESFVTYDDAPVSNECSNQTLRVGLSASLPDCRAWELVTPPEARGPEGAGFEGQRFGVVQSSASGGAVSFEVKAGALPGTEATGYFFGDPYIATRSAAGWSTVLAGPTGTMASKPVPGSFSPDQGYSFWNAEGEGSAIIDGEGANYVRYPDGHSELTGRGSLGTDPRAVGRMITEGGTHIIFETGAAVAPAVQLEPNAPSPGVRTVYDRTLDEVTHVVSLLPGDVTPTKNAFYAGASSDGGGIAFEIEASPAERTLFLRVDNKTTYQIGTGVTFSGVSESGDRIFYVEDDDLIAFDTSSEAEIDFTGPEISSAIPVNVAPQGSRAYFVSETAVGGANPNGDTAQASKPNLYLSEDGEITFVATVTERDVEGVLNQQGGARADGLGVWIEALSKRRPAVEPSRLTPDGSVLVFQARANIDGYEPGEGAQIYRYDHVAGTLDCVSCPPTKTPATGGAVLQSINPFNINAPLSFYGFVPALRADGKRLFFESTEALVSTDTDGLRDIYEWEEEGVGSCTRPSGCVYLISSGESSRPDFLFGHSASGDDVFISTTDALVPGSPEMISIYDARVTGGFASSPIFICPDESCRPAPTLPPIIPQVGVGNKSGNVVRKAKKCPPNKRKAKRKGKVVCVKKKSKKQRQGNKAGTTRRAGR